VERRRQQHEEPEDHFLKVHQHPLTVVTEPALAVMIVPVHDRA